MPSTYSDSLRLELIADGEQAGIWGQTTNRNLGDLLEAAIAGFIDVTIPDGDYTLTASNGAEDESRYAIIKISGATTTTRAVIVPSVSKLYIIANSTPNPIVVRTSGGVGRTVPSGRTAYLIVDGLNVVDALDHFSALVVDLASISQLLVTGSAVIGDQITDSHLVTGRFEVNGPQQVTINSTASPTLDLSLGNYFTRSVAANTTFAFTNPPAGKAFAFTLEVLHTSGTITWPAAVQWPKGIAPILTTGKTHLFVFVTDDGGLRYRGGSLVDYTT